MKNDGSNYGQCTSSFPCTVLLRKEAALQGLTGVRSGTAAVSCYDPEFLSSGGQDVEGQYVDTTFLPFLSKAEQKANPMTANFVKYTGKANAASFGAYTWAAGIAFRDAVNHDREDATASTASPGSRSSPSSRTSTSFDAEGIIAPIDIAGRKITECDVTLQVRTASSSGCTRPSPGPTPARPRTS